MASRCITKSTYPQLLNRIFRPANACHYVQGQVARSSAPSSLNLISPPAAIGVRLSSTHTAFREAIPLRRSPWRRLLTFCALGIVFTTGGFMIAAWPAVGAVNRMITPPSDADSTSLFEPLDDLTAKVDDFLKNHPVAKELRNNPNYIESRPHLKIPPEMRSHSLTGGTLAGPGKLWVPPIVFTEKNGEHITVLAYLGNDLSGHPGFVHGGCMATLMDEGLARCCFRRLPNKIGMTANLNINYKVPLPTDTYICLRGSTTKVEGRKAWVEGHIETLVEPGQPATIHCNATALFVEPRQAATMARLYGSSAA